MKLPTLYKKTSTGAIQQWAIATNGNLIVVAFGQVGGKLQNTTDTILKGKNIGRSNETTPEQQAQAEARSQWEGKVKKGYVQSIDDATSGKVDETVITGGINPMLAHTYAKQGHKITFPAHAQPKLDGHRCVAIVADGKVTLWSRSRKPILGVPHIINELEQLDLPDGTILDGELYNHEYKDRFEELTSYIKRSEPKEGHEVVQYHVYDIVTEGGFNERWSDPTFRKPIAEKDGFVRLVGTRVVADEEQVTEFFTRCLAEGYEGIMLRNSSSPYVNKRSYDLQKVKEFDDSEYKIVDVVPGRGKLTEMGMFICETEDGSRFECKMTGELEGLKKYLANKDDYIGKMLTVQHQGVSAYGIPRFGVGLRLREDV